MIYDRRTLKKRTRHTSINLSSEFLKAFLRQPGSVGAVAPSSRFLAREMVEWFDWSQINAVAEYGPGTGVFTEAILERLQPGATFFVVERNPEFCLALHKRFPQLDICHDSVENICELCYQRSIPQLDAVICGLPWANFPLDLQIRSLDAMRNAMSPNARFATFAYWQGLFLPAAHRFKKLLASHFHNTTSSNTVWLNLPPAFIYRCERPRVSP